MHTQLPQSEIKVILQWCSLAHRVGHVSWLPKSTGKRGMSLMSKCQTNSVSCLLLSIERMTRWKKDREGEEANWYIERHDAFLNPLTA